MSRIVLSRHPDNTEKVVVGWDHPGGGAWWQEFNLEVNPENGEPFWKTDEDWQEVSRYGGYMKGYPVAEFRENVPEDIRPLITDQVLALIERHSKDPNSGRTIVPEVVAA